MDSQNQAPTTDIFTDILENWDNLPAEKPAYAAGNQAKKAKYKKGASIMNSEIERLEYTIESILPRGLFMLVAREKVGKSFMMLQLSKAVGIGGDFLGYKANQGEVLYLALDGDEDRRIKERGELMRMQPQDLTNVTIAYEAPGIANGAFLEFINEYMADNPETKLIIVDLLADIRPTIKSQPPN